MLAAALLLTFSPYALIPLVIADLKPDSWVPPSMVAIVLQYDAKNPSSDAAPFSSVNMVSAHSTRPASSGKSTVPLNIRGKILGDASVFSAKKSATPFA